MCAYQKVRQRQRPLQQLTVKIALSQEEDEIVVASQVMTEYCRQTLKPSLHPMMLRSMGHMSWFEVVVRTDPSYDPYQRYRTRICRCCDLPTVASLDDLVQVRNSGFVEEAWVWCWVSIVVSA
jgi:hypothetical protein